jgi:hypothetical protein
LKTLYRITLKPGSRYTAWVGHGIGYVTVWHELGAAWFESSAKRMIENHKEAAAAENIRDVVVYEETYEG